MSQQSVLSFFKSVKRSNPDQHAAKRRKVVLRNHEIQNLLDTESDGSEAESDLNDSDVGRIIETKLNAQVTSSEDDFVEDSDWEDLANKTLDEVQSETIVSVTTWASDDHNNSNPSPEKFHGFCPEDVSKPIVIKDDGKEIFAVRSDYPRDIENNINKTPTANLKYENLHKSKKKIIVKDSKWTPSSVSDPKFTIGYVDLVPSIGSARKKLTYSKQRKQRNNVTFTKLSKLSKRNLSRVSPTKVNTSALIIQSLPEAEQSPVKHSVNRNLFDDSPAKPQVPDLKDAIRKVKKLEEKKVTPSQIKSKLGNAKLKDLRSLLSSIEGSKLKAEKVRQPTVSPLKSLQPDITLELDVPVSTPVQSPRKSFKTPIKASPRKIPAYQRYHNLSQPVNKTLALPYTYSQLLEVFRSTDTVVSMMFNRQERITITKLTKHTTDIMNKKWNVNKLRQIVCVFPQAYNISWRTCRFKQDSKEMVIEPNMNYKRDLMNNFDESGTALRSMSAGTLVERRDMFRNGLLDIVKDYHEEFLASLDPPIQADRTRLTRWHKDFDLDILPDIDFGELPPNPDYPVHQPQIESKADYLSFNSKLSDVLINLNSVNKNSDFEASTSPSSPAKTTPFFFSPSKSVVSPLKTMGLEGLNPSLLEKVKAKEAAAEKVEMTRSEEQIERIKMLKKLPKLARLIK